MDNETRAFYEQLHAAQAEHPVVEVLSLPELQALGMERAYQMVEARALSIAEMDAKPLEACYVPEDWKLFLLELTRKRLAHPGAVIEFFVSGGIRAGKSFIMAMLFVAHWLHTRKAWCFALAETEETSKDLQQVPIDYFMPPQVSGGESGKVKQKKHERMKFSGGAFTGGAFERYVDAIDEAGRTIKGGGKVRFRMFTQSVKRYRGFSLTMAWSDEAIPVEHVAAVKDRLVSRAVDTKERWHIEKMILLERALVAWIASGDIRDRPHPALLGALMHGMHGISYTPEEGWVPTVRYFAMGAVNREEHMVIAPELDGKPGVLDPRVPKVADCAVPTRALFYLHTRANVIVNAYPELSRTYKDSDERTIRIKLYGDALSAEDRIFQGFTEAHLCTWQDIPRDGTLYELGDPAGTKPYWYMWILVDSMGRRWQLAEWPCPTIPIDLGHGPMLPGAWAVPSQGDKLNGDEGPAYKLRLGWDAARYVYEHWKMRRWILEQFQATGEPFRGRTVRGRKEWRMLSVPPLEGEFIVGRHVIFDPRGGEQPVDGDTMRGKYAKAEHGIKSEHKPPACDDAEGIKLIADALGERIEGAPSIRINRQCENTIFMFRTYTLPAYAESTRRKDEACVEPFDLWKYALKFRLLYYPPRITTTVDEWGYG